MTDAQTDTHVKAELHSAEAEHAIANAVSVIHDCQATTIVMNSGSQWLGM